MVGQPPIGLRISAVADEDVVLVGHSRRPSMWSIIDRTGHEACVLLSHGMTAAQIRVAAASRICSVRSGCDSQVFHPTRKSEAGRAGLRETQCSPTVMGGAELISADILQFRARVVRQNGSDVDRRDILAGALIRGLQTVLIRTRPSGR